MKTKGTAIKSIKDFVLNNYNDKIAEWFNSLSQDSQNILSDAITNEWYPVKEGIVQPTEKIGDLFYNGDEKKAAFECGKYSAEVALKGVYKLYVRFSSPSHVVDRGSRIVSAYYDNLVLTQIGREKGYVQFEIKDTPEINQVIEYRIAGWMYKALEISGCKTYDIKVSESTKTHGRTIFDCYWT